MVTPRLPASYGWVVVGTVAALITATSGARFLFGVVLKPITDEFGWERASLTGAVLVNMLVLSLLQPFLGALGDRIAPKWLLVGGTVLLGGALIPLSMATALWQIYAAYGVVAAVALAATSPVNTTTLVSRWFHERRSTALSIATSGAAFGQLLVVPVATWLVQRTDWETSYRAMAVVLLVVVAPLTALLLREPHGERRAVDRTHDAGVERGELEHDPGADLRQALNTSMFWLLAYGFFVCGFTMAFASTHFLAFADDMGMAPMRAADIVAATAVFSIVGSILLGMAADRHRRTVVLAATYALRGLAFALLLAFPRGPQIYAYAAVLGISWTATTPLTAAITADAYGRRHLGVIFGTMFTFMNVGFGAGSFLDGLIYDLAGGYKAALALNAAIGFVAAAAVLRVHDARPTERARRVDPPTLGGEAAVRVGD